MLTFYSTANTDTKFSLPDPPRRLAERSLTAGCQALPVRPCNDNIISMTVSVEHWLSDIYRAEPNRWEDSQLSIKILMWTALKLGSGLHCDRSAAPLCGLEATLREREKWRCSRREEEREKQWRSNRRLRRHFHCSAVPIRRTSGRGLFTF